MSGNSISFTDFCAWLGVPLRNSRWSWSAHAPEKRRFLFTIWDNEILPDGNSYVLWDERKDGLRSDNGARELKRNSMAASEPEVEAYGVRCFPKYPLTTPRVRDYFDQAELIRLVVSAHEGRYVAHFMGSAIPELLASNLSVSEAMLPSAIDDLADDKNGSILPTKLSGNSTYFVRDRKVRDAVLKRSKGRCEYCGTAGFVLPNGKRFVETHHIIHLANQGPDSVQNVIALCPNHHREAHYGNDRVIFEGKFIEILARVSKG